MIPTSLYIHIPWCIRKCPYCDFNSHKSPSQLPEKDYIDRLLADLRTDLNRFPQRKLSSIFIGGGTPSLISAKYYAYLLDEIAKLCILERDIEITMEANPGTVEQQRFYDYRLAGINRLSLGIQSFNPNHLKKLGRIHDDNQARQAIISARKAGFSNINLDLMHGLPQQTVEQGLFDLQQALDFAPEHLSWYQLTLEPNTVFYKEQPPLPSEETCCDLEEKGLILLHRAGYERYEISAFCRDGKKAAHNLNYWLFGDYYGIGAGAHGKLSLNNEKSTIIRTHKHRQPQAYLDVKRSFTAGHNQLDEPTILFEYMLNTTRLEQAIPYQLLTQRTGLPAARIIDKLQEAKKLGLIQLNDQDWQITAQGRRFTNDLQALFLPG